MKRAILPIFLALVFAPSAQPAMQAYPVGTKLGWATITVAGNTRAAVRADLIQGAGDAQLALGLAHWEETPLPGQGGTVVFSGHRTTWSRPLYDLDRWPLRRTVLRTFMRLPEREAHCYRLVGRKIVRENSTKSAYAWQRWEVVQLWACHPKGQRSHRIIGVFREVPCSEAD